MDVEAVAVVDAAAVTKMGEEADAAADTMMAEEVGVAADIKMVEEVGVAAVTMMAEGEEAMAASAAEEDAAMEAVVTSVAASVALEVAAVVMIAEGEASEEVVVEEHPQTSRLFSRKFRPSRYYCLLTLVLPGLHLVFLNRTLLSPSSRTKW